MLQTTLVASQYISQCKTLFKHEFLDTSQTLPATLDSNVSWFLLFISSNISQKNNNKTTTYPHMKHKHTGLTIQLPCVHIIFACPQKWDLNPQCVSVRLPQIQTLQAHFSLGIQSILNLEGFTERCQAALSSHTPLLHTDSRVTVFLGVSQSKLPSVLKSHIFPFHPVSTLYVLSHMFPLRSACKLQDPIHQ